MKFDIPINYDIPHQKEVIIKANVPSDKIREIVQTFFNKKNYEQRRKWLKENLDEINLNTV
tara:strand:+ start:1420 stop:1602 length:183 start_codon:yes stop_codon:yes gene_type:complete